MTQSSSLSNCIGSLSKHVRTYSQRAITWFVVESDSACSRYRFAHSKYCHCSSTAVSRFPFWSSIGCVHVISSEISRIAVTGLRSANRCSMKLSSIMRRIIPVVPTFKKVENSDILESPTITCRRLYFSRSACGSSRVLIIPRAVVVPMEISSRICSARCEIA